MGRGRRGSRRTTKVDTPSNVSPANGNSKPSTTNDVEAMVTDTAPELRDPDHEEVAMEPKEIVRTDTPTTTSSTKGPPRKRQKREEYRASLKQESQANGDKAKFQVPKKKWFRQRAHANPFSDHSLEYPIGPEQMDWAKHYPAFTKTAKETSGSRQPSEGTQADAPDHQLVKNVEIADIGCGFGGLLFALAPMYPDTLMLGMEIRTSVTEFVENKIRALRQHQLLNADRTAHDEPLTKTTTDTPTTIAGGYQNISVVRTNSMKFLPNFFPRASLKAIFFCFPDPHFKSRKHKARIVSGTLNSEYAYVLRAGGVVATITDVEELSQWMAEKFGNHESFERVEVGGDGTDEEYAGDELLNARVLDKVMRESTEEGKKVDRFGGRKFVGIWRRLKDPDWPGE